MKRRLVIAVVTMLLAVVLFLLSAMQKKGVDNAINSLTAAVKAEPEIWTEVLKVAEQDDVDERAVRELLKELSGHVSIIQKSRVEDGVEILCKYRIIEKEGILLSQSRIEAVPREKDWGYWIEALYESDPVYIYRIYYYWS